MPGLILLLLRLNPLYAQTPLPVTETQAEAVAGRGGDGIGEQDAGWWNDLHQHPLNLNTVDELRLLELGLLSPAQVNNFLRYRELFGRLISIYELQAVPGWDIPLLQQLRPYVFVDGEPLSWPVLWQGLKGGNHQLLLTGERRFVAGQGTDSSYAGSPWRLLLRYRYSGGNGLVYGFTGEKDPGEALLRKGRGFDFYTAHFFMRRPGRLRALALGDFTVQMGQGLLQWQGFAASKGGEVLQIKRQGPVLRPYRAGGEFYFHRGAGVTLGLGRWGVTAFVSLRRLDANRVTDSTGAVLPEVSALQTSGYHRTAGELADRAIQRQKVLGVNVEGKFGGARIGANLLSYRFMYPFVASADWYRQYNFRGDRLLNYSVYYSVTHGNAHFFGEGAADGNRHIAFVQGIMLSAAPTVDLAMLYRHIDRGFSAFYNNPFTESSSTACERGCYFAVALRPAPAWRIQAYADVYRYPWLRYRTDAPSDGEEYWLQTNWKPNKLLEAYFRFRSVTRVNNSNAEGIVLPLPEAVPVRSWRLQVQYRLHSSLLLRQRAEMISYNAGAPTQEDGFALYNDLVYKPLLKRYGGNLRLMYVETGGYNTRIYAYENDVLFSGGGVPAFYGRAWRAYLNVHVDFGKYWSAWVRLARTGAISKSLITSALPIDNPDSNKDLTIQVRWQF